MAVHIIHLFPIGCLLMEGLECMMQHGEVNLVERYTKIVVATAV